MAGQPTCVPQWAHGREAGGELLISASHKQELNKTCATKDFKNPSWAWHRQTQSPGTPPCSQAARLAVPQTPRRLPASGPGLTLLPLPGTNTIALPRRWDGPEQVWKRAGLASDLCLGGTGEPIMVFEQKHRFKVELYQDLCKPKEHRSRHSQTPNL